MAKRSRGRVTREPPPAQTTQRVQRPRPRRTPRRTAEQPFFDRYRSLIIGGLAFAGLLVIGFLFFQGATSAAYECRSLLTPGPSEPVPTVPPATPSPPASPTGTAAGSPSPTGASPSPTGDASPSPTGAGAASPSPTGGSPSPTGGSPSPSPSPAVSPSPVPSPTARLGFTVADLGAFHVADPGAAVRYDYCPPASGDHYNLAGVAPMPPAVYPPANERSPGFWIHNLEHGYTVVLYRCPSGQLGVGECITQAEFNQLEQFYEQAPRPSVSSCPTKVLVARFDEMSTDFAVLAWDRALLLDEFELDKAMTFAEQWMEHVAAPEPTTC